MGRTDESIGIRDALKSYTIWSARQMFLEDEIGSLEVGKYADIAVWDRDLYAVETHKIKDASCQLTLFNGTIVYVNPETRIAVAQSEQVSTRSNSVKPRL